MSSSMVRDQNNMDRHVWELFISCKMDRKQEVWIHFRPTISLLHIFIQPTILVFCFDNLISLSLMPTLVSLLGLLPWCEGEEGSGWICDSLPRISRPEVAMVDESHGSSEALRLRLLWCPGEESLGSTRDCLLEFARELGTVRTRPLRDLQTTVGILVSKNCFCENLMEN